MSTHRTPQGRPLPNPAREHSKQWPDHIDLPVNNWVFTPDELERSPTAVYKKMNKQQEKDRLNHFASCVTRLAKYQNIMFSSLVYLRRLYQRMPLAPSEEKTDKANVGACVFLAARTLERHIPVTNMVGRLMEEFSKGPSSSRAKKDQYAWRDALLRAEMVVMDKLCCDFIIFDPFHEMSYVYSKRYAENPYEMSLDDYDVNRFWATFESRSPDANNMFRAFAARLVTFARTEMVLLFKLEDISIFTLIVCVGRTKSAFPRDYFKVRGITVDIKVIEDMCRYLDSLPVNPQMEKRAALPRDQLERAFQYNIELLGPDYVCQNDNAPFTEPTTGAATAIGSSGLDPENTEASQKTEFGGHSEYTKGTDYGQGSETPAAIMNTLSPRRDNDHTPSDPQNSTYLQAPTHNQTADTPGGYTAGSVRAHTLHSQAPVIPMKAIKSPVREDNHKRAMGTPTKTPSAMKSPLPLKSEHEKEKKAATPTPSKPRANSVSESISHTMDLIKLPSEKAKSTSTPTVLSSTTTKPAVSSTLANVESTAKSSDTSEEPVPKKETTGPVEEPKKEPFIPPKQTPPPPAAKRALSKPPPSPSVPPSPKVQPKVQPKAKPPVSQPKSINEDKATKARLLKAKREQSNLAPGAKPKVVPPVKVITRPHVGRASQEKTVDSPSTKSVVPIMQPAANHKVETPKRAAAQATRATKRSKATPTNSTPTTRAKAEVDTPNTRPKRSRQNSRAKLAAEELSAATDRVLSLIDDDPLSDADETIL